VCPRCQCPKPADGPSAAYGQPPAAAAAAYGAAPHGRPVQVDSIKTGVESAYGFGA